MDITVKHYDNGNIREIRCYNDEDEFHNPNGPAIQEWYENGQEKYRDYRIAGQRHRDDGPAMQWWYKDGKGKTALYRLHGRVFSKKEFEERKNTIEITVGDKTKRISRESAKALNLI